MGPLIQAYVQQGYPIRTIDASAQPQVAQQYGVSRFPTFVMLVDGQEIARHEGAMDGNQLQQLFQQAKDKAAAPAPRRGEAAPVAPRPQDRTAPSAQNPADPAFASLLGATVRLRIDDGQYRSFGTGTIIDARKGEALIITCGHLFRDSKGKSAVNVEMFESVDGRLKPAGQ